MSSTDTRVSLAEAAEIAGELRALLLSSCERITIAGSLRRLSADVGDVDLLCQPKIEQEMTGLFEDQPVARDLLHETCERLRAEGVLEKRLNHLGRAAWGAKFKLAVYRGMGIDIQSCADSSAWGAWLLIRTGPATWNKAIVTPRHQGGLLPPGLEWKNGFQLWRYGGRVETPTELDVFEALGIPYLAPELRAATLHGDERGGA